MDLKRELLLDLAIRDSYFSLFALLAVFLLVCLYSLSLAFAMAVLLQLVGAVLSSLAIYRCFYNKFEYHYLNQSFCNGVAPAQYDCLCAAHFGWIGWRFPVARNIPTGRKTQSRNNRENTWTHRKYNVPYTVFHGCPILAQSALKCFCIPVTMSGRIQFMFLEILVFSLA